MSPFCFKFKNPILFWANAFAVCLFLSCTPAEVAMDRHEVPDVSNQLWTSELNKAQSKAFKFQQLYNGYEQNHTACSYLESIRMTDSDPYYNRFRLLADIDHELLANKGIEEVTQNEILEYLNRNAKKRADTIGGFVDFAASPLYQIAFTQFVEVDPGRVNFLNLVEEKLKDGLDESNYYIAGFLPENGVAGLTSQAIVWREIIEDLTPSFLDKLLDTIGLGGIGGSVFKTRNDIYKAQINKRFPGSFDLWEDFRVLSSSIPYKLYLNGSPQLSDLEILERDPDELKLSKLASFLKLAESITRPSKLFIDKKWATYSHDVKLSLALSIEALQEDDPVSQACAITLIHRVFGQMLTIKGIEKPPFVNAPNDLTTNKFVKRKGSTLINFGEMLVGGREGNQLRVCHTPGSFLNVKKKNLSILSEDDLGDSDNATKFAIAKEVQWSEEQYTCLRDESVSFHKPEQYFENMEIIAKAANTKAYFADKERGNSADNLDFLSAMAYWVFSFNQAAPWWNTSHDPSPLITKDLPIGNIQELNHYAFLPPQSVALALGFLNLGFTNFEERYIIPVDRDNKELPNFNDAGGIRISTKVYKKGDEGLITTSARTAAILVDTVLKAKIALDRIEEWYLTIKPQIHETLTDYKCTFTNKKQLRAQELLIKKLKAKYSDELAQDYINIAKERCRLFDMFGGPQSAIANLEDVLLRIKFRYEKSKNGDRAFKETAWKNFEDIEETLSDLEENIDNASLANQNRKAIEDTINSAQEYLNFLKQHPLIENIRKSDRIKNVEQYISNANTFIASVFSSKFTKKSSQSKIAKNSLNYLRKSYKSAMDCQSTVRDQLVELSTASSLLLTRFVKHRKDGAKVCFKELHSNLKTGEETLFEPCERIRPDGLPSTYEWVKSSFRLIGTTFQSAAFLRLAESL